MGTLEYKYILYAYMEPLGLGRGNSAPAKTQSLVPETLKHQL